ncbi:hypothetical protein [Serratia nevei]|uniref:hypothetical protein n=1 Tax=Serratia nevei TaxID=2703794 RepID=UPI003F7DC42C
MESNVSELSRPVAEVVSKFGDPEAFGEREIKLLTGIQQMAYGTKFYSQEYISVLRTDAAKWFDAYKKAVSVGARYEERISELEKRLELVREQRDSELRTNTILEKRLATPVRLPVPYSPDPWMSPDPDGTWLDKEDVKKSIRDAGFKVGGNGQ